DVLGGASCGPRDGDHVRTVAGSRSPATVRVARGPPRVVGGLRAVERTDRARRRPMTDDTTPAPHPGTRPVPETAQATPPHGTALVTGGTSGIGLELARELARRGHDVLVVADRDVETTVHRLREETGAYVTGLVADLARPEGVEETVARAREFGVRTLVLNAGVGVHGPFT